ncbi:unnamed protein product [Peniophora sp. CBMAI 1063]|nr:unnamed protein product [Peniophora sp. CBMAI 1063]
MEWVISYIDYNATKYQVQKALETVLHGPDIYDPDDPKHKGRKPNFLVELVESEIGRLHKGTGFLTLPNLIGKRFAQWLREPANKKAGIRVLNKKLHFKPSPRKIWQQKKQILENALYIGPEQEEEHEKILAKTAVQLRVARVQFGVWYRPPTPKGGRIPDRMFSVEYERDYTQNSAAYIEVDYDSKCIRVELGERHADELCKYVVIKYTSIKKMGIGFDFGHPFIVFDMYVPPVFEEKNFSGAPRDGYQRRKNKDRDRVSALDDRHAFVAPYSPHLRVLLFRRDDLLSFERLCEFAQCEPRPIRVPTIEASKLEFFTRKNLNRLHIWMTGMDWKNAFQIEALLRSNLLTMEELLGDMRLPISDVMQRYGSYSSEILRLYNVELQMRQPGEPALACLDRVIDKNASPSPLRMNPGWFLCHHITFTPTRVLLEGPYATASNRIIRRYQKETAPNQLDNFVRVDFRDEDRLSYRWDRQVDATYFLQNRVGTILKEGFELGGKRFEFLAYSNSALKTHAVWFMSPFTDPDEGYVDSERIRRKIGDFGDLWTQPSKLAARIAQAFSATDPSVTLVKGQWEEMDDIETAWTTARGEDATATHTDGVGTISPELGDMIWSALCEASSGWRQNRVKPSVYQIRFLGYKGVVVVDERLEGILMRLRPSQRKFESHMVESAGIEIARAFDYPNRVHLNRPVIMVLEDRGVDKEQFIELQEDAKRDVLTAEDSIGNFAKHLRANNAGGKFHLAFILECLELFGLDLTAREGKTPVGSELFARLLRYAVNDSLRTMKHKARIPVPGSYQLVGVADEGQAYIKEGEDPNDVFTLDMNQIYVCIQEDADSEPIYLKGKCVVSRSPVVHPGDVINVFAIGKPPAGKKCFFRNLKNVVVLPVGTKHDHRSIASCLGGGDLDGDVYDIYYKHQGLAPTTVIPPAEYPTVKAYTLPDGRTATVEDICDFIVEYINSDVLGLLAKRHLTIADQSKEGTSDPRCMKLAELCSRAVDYQKHGNAIDPEGDGVPYNLMHFKPDWHQAEIADPRVNDYYISNRALGHLYRGITLLPLDQPVAIPVTNDCPPMGDAISLALAPTVQRLLLESASDNPGAENEQWSTNDVASLFGRYYRELRYIRATHTLADMPGVCLAEEEVILGAILSDCTQPRWRADRVYRLRLHAEALVSDTRRRLLCEADALAPDDAALRAALARSWVAWEWAQRNAKMEGTQSFGLLVLGVVCDCLKRLDALPVRAETPEDDSDAEDDYW